MEVDLPFIMEPPPRSQPRTFAEAVLEEQAAWLRLNHRAGPVDPAQYEADLAHWRKMAQLLRQMQGRLTSKAPAGPTTVPQSGADRMAALTRKLRDEQLQRPALDDGALALSQTLPHASQTLCERDGTRWWVEEVRSGTADARYVVVLRQQSAGARADDPPHLMEVHGADGALFVIGNGVRAEADPA